MSVTERTAELVLVTPDGALLGRLLPLPVATPWWNEVEPVVQTVRDHYGIEITVLRLLSAERDEPHGGRVTYLAETAAAPAAEPWEGSLDDHPLRQSYARCGGPAADLAWAYECLAARGYVRTGPPVQVRSWNLSSLWRIPVAGEMLWLKVVPPFFAHEGAMLSRLAGQAVPKLVGHAGPRLLLAEIAGQDLYRGASLAQLKTMVSLLVEIQADWMGREPELLALGLPDWRLPVLAAGMADVVERTSVELALADSASLHQLLGRLPELASEIAACGLPPTLVHGDFHPGNARGSGVALTLLDWADSGLGHPLLDQAALLTHIPDAMVDSVRDHWHAEWRRLLPGSNPDRAGQLMRPLAAMRQAVIYRRFLDNIEAAEHVYHRTDPALWLGRAAGLWDT